jgi:hypothetical protein
MLIATGRSDCAQANTIAKQTSHIKAPARHLALDFEVFITVRFPGFFLERRIFPITILEGMSAKVEARPNVNNL